MTPAALCRRLLAAPSRLQGLMWYQDRHIQRAEPRAQARTHTSGSCAIGTFTSSPILATRPCQQGTCDLSGAAVRAGLRFVGPSPATPLGAGPAACAAAPLFTPSRLPP
jgi:hypothetical protein